MSIKLAIWVSFLLWSASLRAQPGPHGPPPWAWMGRQELLKDLAHRAEVLLGEASRKGVAEGDSQKAELFLLARGQLREGIRALRKGQYRLAFRLLDQARFLGEFLVGRRPRRPGVEEAIRGSRLILRQIKELGPPPPWFKEAEELQRKAEDDVRHGRYDEARRKVRRLRSLLFMSPGDIHPSPERVGKVVERTGEMIGRWSGPIRDSGVPEAIFALRRASDHQGEALKALKSGKLRKALLRTHMAMRMLLRAMSLAGIPIE